MSEYLFYLNNLFQLITLIIVLLCHKKIKGTSERYFPFFLMITFIIDSIISPCIGNLTEYKNYFIYNSYILFYFIFYFIWFQNITNGKHAKQLILCCLSVTILFYIYNLTFQDFFNEYLSMSFIVGSFFLVICSSYKFIQILKEDNVIEFKSNISFWIIVGLLIFSVGIIPLLYFNQFLNSSSDVFISHIIIIILLNAILYGCYSIGFLWSKKS